MRLIHKEGTKILIISAIIFIIICLLCFYFFGLGIVSYSVLSFSIILYIFFISFFRYPNRIVSNSSDILVAPADGTIVVVEETIENEILKQPCIQISIFMSVWNVHMNWIPMSGILKYFKYHPGKYLVADKPKSSEFNERTTLMIENEKGNKVVIRQIAGYVARRIVTYTTKPGTKVISGDQLGFIKFGSRVDIFLPLETEILVKQGQKTKGCITPIARL